MKAKSKIFFACIVTILLLHINTVFSSATPKETSDVHEVVFVLDTSGSMKDNDSELLAPDSLKLLASSLPSNSKIGAVTYNSQVVDAAALTDNAETIVAMLTGVSYNGYTNTGAGLMHAMKLFSDDAASKSIVLLTDGEIDMWTPQETQTANNTLNHAIEQASSAGVKIHTIRLGNSFEVGANSIRRCAEETGGQVYEAPSATELSQMADRLLSESLGINKAIAGAAQMTGSSGKYAIQLPFSGLTAAKVLIISDSAVEDVVVSGAAQNVQILTGKRFAVVSLAHPSEKDITIEFASTGANSAQLILDWDVSLQAQVAYTDELMTTTESIQNKEVEVEYYKRTAEIQLSLLDSNGENVLQGNDFEGKIFTVTVNNEPVQCTPQNGYLHLERNVQSDEMLSIDVALDSLGVNFTSIKDSIDVSIAGPPETSATINPIVLIVTIIGLVLAILVLSILFYSRDQRKKKETDQEAPAFLSKFEFTGKLNLYITKTQEDIDIPPQTFDLFRMGKKREISLKSILEKCRITNEFSGTEKIYFVADKNGTVVIVNDSDCTILIGSDILVKTRSHRMEYGEKVYVSCEDGSEMELHYKSVKPSEKTSVPNPLIRYTN